MNRSSKLIACAIVTAGLLIGVLVLAAAKPGVAFWTDADTIRAPQRAAPVRTVLWRPAEPVSASLSSAVDEYEPRLSADGTLMVFVRRRAGDNADILTSRWSPAGWSAPEPITALNTDNDELGPEFSSDGRSLYFYSDRPGGLGGYDLWVSRQTDGGAASWGEPINLGPAINSPFNEYGPALTPDGACLYFSSNRPRPDEPAASPESWDATIRERRTRHDYDLYASDLTSQEPAPAQAIAQLNTPDDEGSPAVSSAGDFLYFSSDRPGGRGGYDLLRARLLRGTPQTPENLGEAVNSPANDLDPGLSADGFRLYFSSDRAMAVTDTAPPAAAQVDTPEPPDYGLWCTASREVFLESEQSGSMLAELWSSIWPWLLLLALLLTLLFLLSKTAAEPDWRRRFARLGLLAQCLLISLATHLVIASLLTVWYVGGRIGEVIRAGGTRVILASSGDAGDVAGQIYAAVGASALPELTLSTPEIGLTLPSLPAAMIETVPDPRSTLAEAPMVDAAPPEGSTPAARSSPAPDAVAPDHQHVASALPDAPAPSASQAEPDRQLPTTTLPSAPPAMQVSAVELSELQPVGSVAANEGEPLRVEVATSESRPNPALPVLSALAPSERRELSLPAAASPSAATAEPTPQVPLPGSSPRPAMAAASGEKPGTIDVSPLPRSAPVETGVTPLAMSARPHAAPETIASESDTVRAPRASTPSVALPQLAQQSGAEAEPSLASSHDPASASHAAAAIAPQLTSITTQPGDSIEVHPLAASNSDDVLALAPSTPSPGRSSTQTTASPAPSAPTSGNLAAGVRLPTAPSEPSPRPVETFAQRDPAVRDEIVEQTGGTPESERAVGLALEWFKRQQSAGGAWIARDHEAEVNADAAMTGMALLCFLGAGHTHTADGPYRKTVDSALMWLLQRQRTDGDLRQGETMYGQTIATVALCEAYAMTRDPRLADPARRAVAFVVARAAQSRQGRASAADTSVLGWQVMAMESARRAGITPPRDTFDAAKSFLDQVSRSNSRGLYSHRAGESPSPAMTAEAMFVQQLLGRTRDDPRMQQSAKFLLDTPPNWRNGAPTYYWYYATLALFQHQGDEWREWNRAIVRELLTHQRTDGNAAGSWDPHDEWSRLGGRVYQTAVCTLSLEVYYRYRAAPQQPDRDVAGP